jgi:hypothetical protein
MNINLPSKDLMSDGFGDTAILNAPQVAETDLSAQIQRAVEKDPLDQVKCVHVFDDYYRCNWWAQPALDVAGRHASIWGMVATQRVRKSRFLNVTLVDGALVMKEILSR